MTNKEFSAAVAIAQSEVELLHHDISIFDGYGLSSFGRVSCTLPAVAMLIRWQCAQLNGAYDQAELNALRGFARRKFDVVGFGDHELCDPKCGADQLLATALMN